MINEQQKTTTYDNAVTYLYNLQKFGIKLGLSNMFALSEILGRPEQTFSSIHVAGTNGKGSTSSMIASMLEEQGFKVGLFLSPHFKSFTERISINKHEISETACLELTNYIQGLTGEKLPELKPTFFEFVTALALYYFAQQQVDYAVLETGMGGRLDATNIVSPLVSVITHISLDHSAYLGKNIREIAFEKAGIIKSHTSVVTCADGEALVAIKEAASEKNADIHVYGSDFSFTDKSQPDEYSTFSYNGFSNYDNLSLPLFGKHQLMNASTAIRVYEVLQKNGHVKHFEPDSVVRTGLEKIKVSGRCEVISKEPLIVIDGAHNPDAAQALSHTLRDIFPHKKVILLIGVMSDKDAQGILAPLASLSRCIIFSRARGDRSSKPEDLMSCLSPSEQGTAIISVPVKDALEIALSEYTGDDVVVITGSFYIAGEAMEVLSGKGILSSLRE